MPLARASRAGARWPWIGVALLVALVACNPGEYEPLYAADFEDVCEGAACSWERVLGEPEQATWVETIHPGEHGLRLAGEVTVRGPGTDVFDPVVVDRLQVQVAARCDAASLLHLELVLADGGGVRFGASVWIYAAETWDGPLIYEYLTIDGPGSNASRVIAVAITKTGTGACEISDLVIGELLPSPGC